MGLGQPSKQTAKRVLIVAVIILLETLFKNHMDVLLPEEV